MTCQITQPESVGLGVLQDFKATFCIHVLLPRLHLTFPLIWSMSFTPSSLISTSSS